MLFCCVLCAQHLVDILSKDDVEVRRRLSEMTRRMTVLRVNEKALVRRHAILEEVGENLRKVSFTDCCEMYLSCSMLKLLLGYHPGVELSAKEPEWCSFVDFIANR